jgi:hypothetical protein
MWVLEERECWFLQVAMGYSPHRGHFSFTSGFNHLFIQQRSVYLFFILICLKILVPKFYFTSPVQLQVMGLPLTISHWSGVVGQL